MLCTFCTVLCTFSVILGSADCKRDRQINLALDTVVNFHKKDHASDLRLIDNVQKFLNKLKRAIRQRPEDEEVRRYSNVGKHTSLPELLRRLILVVLSYDDDDIEEVARVLSRELRKYHYKGCKFYELTAIPEFRKVMSTKLDELNMAPAKYVREKLNDMLQTLQKQNYGNKEKELFDFVETLYDKEAKKQFNEIIQSLNTYKSKTKRGSINLKRIIKHSIRDNVFDHYTKLETNTRRKLRILLEAVVKKDHKKHTYKWSYSDHKDKEVENPSKLRSAKKKVVENTSDTEPKNKRWKRHKKSKTTESTTRKMRTKKMKRTPTTITTTTTTTTTEEPAISSDWEIPDTSPRPNLIDRGAKSEEDIPKPESDHLKSRKKAKKIKKAKASKESKDDASKEVNDEASKEIKDEASKGANDDDKSTPTKTSHEIVKKQRKQVVVESIESSGVENDKVVPKLQTQKSKKRTSSENAESISEFKEASTKRRKKRTKRRTTKKVHENFATGFLSKGYKKRYSKKSNAVQSTRSNEDLRSNHDDDDKPRKLSLKSVDVNVEYSQQKGARSAVLEPLEKRNKLILRLRSNAGKDTVVDRKSAIDEDTVRESKRAVEIERTVTTDVDEGLTIESFEPNPRAQEDNIDLQLEFSYRKTLTPPEITITDKTTKVTQVNDIIKNNLIVSDSETARRSLDTKSVEEKPTLTTIIEKKIQPTLNTKDNQTIQEKKTIVTPKILITTRQTTAEPAKTKNIMNFIVTLNATTTINDVTTIETPTKNNATSTTENEILKQTVDEFTNKEFNEILQKDMATAAVNMSLQDNTFDFDQKDPFGGLDNLASVQTTTELSTAKGYGLVDGDPLGDIYEGF